MSLVELVFSIVKIALVLGFMLGVGGALTWNDRRMSAMIQDRVGPNRARFVLPQKVAQGMFAGTGLLVAALVIVLFVILPLNPRPGPEAQDVSNWWALVNQKRAVEIILITLELSVLLAWVSLAMLTAWALHNQPENGLERFLATKVKDPRRIAVMGFLLHALGFVARYAARDSVLSPYKRELFLAAPIVLAVTLVGVGALAALKVKKDGFKLRMAGLLHTAADGLKMIFKEDFMPKAGDRFLHSVAPMIALLSPLLIFTVIPFGDVLCLRPDGGPSSTVERWGLCQSPSRIPIPMQVADLDVGILFIFAVAGTGIIGAALAGWASDNKYSLLGGLRGASQMVSYEVTLGLTVVGAFMIYGTLRLDDMVRWQGNNLWGIFVQPLAFLLFFVAATAETKRIPFDLPEGESEIVGYFTEYSGMKFGMFFFAEYIEIVTSSALLVTLFLGGWQVPFLVRDGVVVQIGDAVLFQYSMQHVAVVLLQVIAFFSKVLAVAWLQAVVRWTLPRFRYDQLMKLGWRMILPISLANILVTGVAIVAIDHMSLPVQNGLDLVADVSQLLLALAAIAGAVGLVLWLFQPVRHQKSIVSSSAEMAEKRGGTRTDPLQA